MCSRHERQASIVDSPGAPYAARPENCKLHDSGRHVILFRRHAVTLCGSLATAGQDSAHPLTEPAASTLRGRPRPAGTRAP